ncbi:MAG: outer membrane beta-barrel protein [Flavobacteriales bacterium]
MISTFLRFLPAFGLLFLLVAESAHAQRPGGGGAPAMGKVYGRLLDAATGKPAEFATIAVFMQRNDSLLGGTIVRPNGDFSVEKLPLGALRVEISFIGYTPRTELVTLSRERMESDLGNLDLAADAELLQEVEITGRSSQVVMKVDRRVFNVERDLTTRGGSGVDVMKNIPGLSVDVEGNVQMRGGSPQILIDGRPSAITLDQIPSEDIERIEVITNPSVVFDASSTGGIINVILKKNTKPGYFGQLQGGIGTNNRYQASGNLTVKEGKVGVNLSYNYNTSQNETDGRTTRVDLVDGSPSAIFQQEAENRSGSMMNGGRIGLDWEISNRNTLSVSQNVRVRSMDGEEEQVFRSTTAGGEPISSGTQFNTSLSENFSTNSQIMFRRKSPKEGKEWTADVNYNHWQRDSRSAFTTSTFGNTGEQLNSSPRTQNNLGGAFLNGIRAQFDVVDPLNDRTKIEWGAMGSYTLDNTWLFVSQTSPLIGTNIPDTGQTNDYYITDIVNAAYFNVSRQLNDRWAFQGGLRLEQTYFEARLEGKDQTIGYRYPNGTQDLAKTIFPAMYLVRRWKDSTRELQLNFSRKIQRPRFWQITPFIQIADSRNIRIGNPALAPEMRNMAELNHLLPTQKGKGSWLSSLYARYDEDAISQVAFASESDPDILVNTWVNGRGAFEYGWENTLRVQLAKGLITTMSSELEYINVQLGGMDAITNSGLNWEAKLLVSYELQKSWVFQVNGDYRSPQVIPQGTRISNYGVDASVSKEINKQWNVVLSVNDVFFSRRWGYAYDTPTFTQDDFRRREMRFVRFTATWQFGQRDASLFRKRGPQRTEPSLRGGGGQEE